MMESSFISLVFFGSLLIYFYMGMYIYSLDTRDAVHRRFFFLCLSLSTWALSFSVLTHTDAQEVALYSLGGSVWGWGFTYSFLLHLVLTLVDPMRDLRTWQKGLLYLPIPVNIMLFYGSMNYYDIFTMLKLGPSGWFYGRTEMIFFIWLLIYYLITMAMILFLLYRREPKADDVADIRAKRLIRVTMVISLILGLPKIFGLYERMGWDLVGLGPLHLLPVMITLFLVLLKRGRRKQKENITLPQRGDYLSVRTHERIFYYVSQAYILAGFVAFNIEVFIKQEKILRTSILSITLFLTGFLIFFLLRSRLSVKKRDGILFMIMALTIPFIAFYQLNHSDAFAWAAPVIFLLIAVAFNNRRLLAYTSLMTFLTLILLWVLKPESQQVFEAAEHSARMVVFLVIIALAFLVNTIYSNRQTQFEKQIDHERFLADTSRLLSSARNNSLDSNLDVFLKRTLKYMQGDYAAIHILSDEIRMIRKAEAYGEHQMHEKNIFGAIKSSFEVQMEFLLKDEDLYTETFFQGLKKMAEELKQEGLDVMILPLIESGKILGVICIASEQNRYWDEGYQNTFKLVAGTLSSMLYKIGKEDALFRMAYYDHLTGLPNRLLYEEIITREIRETEEKEMLALIFLDLDDFKYINDIHGHSIGDWFLLEFTRKITSMLNKKDMMSRFGGDEFLILYPHARSFHEIEAFAEEILKGIIEPFQLNDREVRTGASMGIAVYPKDGSTGEELIKYADLAMYHAKSTGKNRYIICTESIKDQFLREQELEEDLRKALARKEFQVYYQPKVHGVTERISGVEALIRWNHPVKGMVSPGEFLSIAERIGLMADIDSWVFMEASRQIHEWRGKGCKDITMSINITPSSFTQIESISHIEELFIANQWDPGAIELEITESTMFFSLEQIRERLTRLRKEGISISLDDFGKAYSSLSRLHELPIDKVKIDRKFINNLHKEERGKSLYDGILDLSRSLGLQVIVEGVETKEQADYVRSKGCDEIQGFYYYRPMPAMDVEKLLQKMKSESKDTEPVVSDPLYYERKAIE